MTKGIESFKHAVLNDTKDGENCFNENGCDHEFYRMEPEDNPGLIKMGFTSYCRKISKCGHKYCDKFKWVIDRAKHYAEKTGRPFDEILEIWEKNRTYWYMNYYHEANQPLAGRKYGKEQLPKLQEENALLIKEVENYKFLIDTLTQEHQNSTKNDLQAKLESLQKTIESNESQIQFIEIMCFEEN